jgi:hypothetical protein
MTTGKEQVREDMKKSDTDTTGALMERQGIMEKAVIR